MKQIALFLMFGPPALGFAAKYVPELAPARDSAKCVQIVHHSAKSKLVHGQSAKLIRQAKSCR